MTGTKGKVMAVNGNMVSVRFDGAVSMNEVGYVKVGGKSLKSEVIRIRGDISQLQVFEITKGISVGDPVEYSGDMLAVEVGPGLLGQVFDGLQNPLPKLVEEAGNFLERGVYLDPLPTDKKWDFTPAVKAGDRVERADTLGTVPEGAFTHRIMVPFNLYGSYTVASIKEAGSYTIRETVAELTDEKGKVVPVTMSFRWPVKRPVDCFEERLKPEEPMVTRVRLIDTFFPVARGGTYCIPGPFGAGKTVLQQITSRHADVDIVILAACGERAGEVVETLKEFP
ncbi:MAG: V-type ATP synthase subunit A, partial [Spirochaetaceae bacterium]|nr:V-type ATP synthase subunit A [Spirochaetaceae bacterium]